MEIANHGADQGFRYVNPNNRTLTSNRKNTEIKDRDNFDCMQRLLNPVEDMVKALTTPIKLADQTSINRATNTLTIATGTQISVNDGYFLIVTERGVECRHGKNYDPYDTEAYKRAQGLAGSLAVLLRNAGGTQQTTAFSQEEYQKWTGEVSTVLSYMGIDSSRNFTLNGMKYSKNRNGFWESAREQSAKAAYEKAQANNRTYTYADERTRNQISYISSYYLENVSEQMQAAWQKALEETGVNPFPEGYGSTLSQLSMEQDFATGGNDDILGEDVESNIAAVQNIIDRIDHPLGDVPEKTRNFRAEERVFYTAVLEHLTAPESKETAAATTSVTAQTASAKADYRTAEDIKEENRVSENNTVNNKAAWYAEQAFASVGSKAPEEVKWAWMEAARETGTNGLGINSNGMMSHISQMMIQRLKKSWLGGTDDRDILGNTVSSALQAARQALYDLENPLTPDNTRSIEVQQSRMKEKAFYQAFIQKLEEL